MGGVSGAGWSRLTSKITILAISEINMELGAFYAVFTLFLGFGPLTWNISKRVSLVFLQIVVPPFLGTKPIQIFRSLEDHLFATLSIAQEKIKLETFFFFCHFGAIQLNL